MSNLAIGISSSSVLSNYIKGFNQLILSMWNIFLHQVCLQSMPCGLIEMCTEQNINNQRLTQVSQRYVNVYFCLKVIRSWLNLSSWSSVMWFAWVNNIWWEKSVKSGWHVVEIFDITFGSTEVASMGRESTSPNFQ